MDKLWSRVAALKGQTIETVTGKSLNVDCVTPTYVEVTPTSTRRSRRIERSQIERAYTLRSKSKSLRPSEVRAAGISEYSPAYVAALINAIS